MTHWFCVTVMYVLSYGSVCRWFQYAKYFSFFISCLLIWNQDNLQVQFVLSGWRLYQLLFMYSLLYTIKLWWRTNVMSSNKCFLLNSNQSIIWYFYTLSSGTSNVFCSTQEAEKVKHIRKPAFMRLFKDSYFFHQSCHHGIFFLAGDITVW